MKVEKHEKTSHVISDRCMRCYGEQEWYGKNFLFSYLGEKNLKGKKVLEIGCAEAGLLKFFMNEGATCYGVELSDIRFQNAILLNKDTSIKILQANICKPETYENKIDVKFDFIVIRDVIEHILERDSALENIFQLLKPKGRVFMSYPPKYCAYAGHQQTIPTRLGKLPYLHLLPNFFYIRYLKLIKCSDKKIQYLLDTKKTRISINEMRKNVISIGYKIIKESNWFIRPAYSYRFGLPKIKNPFRWIPIFEEVFCNGILFLLERPDK